MKTQLSILLLILLMFATIAQADTSQQWEDDFSLSLAQQVEAFEVPGAVVMVVRGDEVIYESAFGVTDLNTGDPMTTDTLFRIGSITKPLSAAYVAHLVDAGVLDWEDPIRQFVPDMQGEATFADLLSHRHGLLPTETDFLLYSDQLAPDDILAELNNLPQAEASFSYNNTAFSAGVYASLLAQGFSQDDLPMAYITQMHDIVFAPTGMTTAIFADELPTNAAHPHTLDGLSGLQPLANFHLGGTQPAGGVIATGYDLAAFAAALLRSEQNTAVDRLVSPEQVQTLWAPAVENAFGDPNLQYGLGWGIDETNDLRRVFHAGDLGGYASLLTLYPDESTALIILTNRDNNNFRLAAQALFETVHFDRSPEQGELLIAAYLEQYIGIKTQVANALAVAQLTFPSDEVAAWLGNYERGWGVERRADDSLWLTHPNGAFRLVNVPGLGFVTANGLAVGIPVTFNNDNLTILGGGTMSKLTDATPEQSSLPDVVSYRNEDITFSSANLTFAGTITIPEGGGPFPAVAIISGSGPSLRSGSVQPLADYNMYTALADQLTQNGIIVLRYDDRGVGESEGDYAAATLDDLALDAGAAVEYLHNRAEVDAERIGLIGHSEGGIIAPQTVANRDDVAFVITIGGPAVEMTQILAEQNRNLFSALGADTTTATAIATQFPRIQTAYLAGDSALLREAVTRLVELQTGSVPSKTLIDQSVAQIEGIGNLGYWTYDVAGAWQQVDLPVLAVFGGNDTQVSAAQNAPAITAILGERVTVVTIDAMNHIFQAAVTGLPNEYGQLASEPMPQLIQTLVDWIGNR